jgi:flagellar basal body-associated protein FliL
MSGEGYLILITGLISMILAVGAIFWFGTKHGDDEKDSNAKKSKMRH